MKRLLGYLLILAILCSNAFASEEYNLSTAKTRVVNENINIAIAYENYVAVKSQAQVKALQLLPSITIDMLIYNYQYTILRSIIPEPSRFFDAAAAKDLAKAASVNRTIVKMNLLEDLEKTYFLIQFHKEAVVSLNKELEIKKIIASRVQEAYDLGAVGFEEFYNTQREVTLTKSSLVSAVEIVKSEEFALKLILQVKNNLDLLILDQAEFYNETLDFPSDTEQAMNLAANNSKEVAQFDYLIEAAGHTKKGVSLSFISWNGVGFDYFARVSIAKSEIRKLELQRTKAVYEVKNQVAASYEEIRTHKEKMAYQDQLLAMAQEDYVTASANYNNQLGTLISMKRAELNLLVAERESRRLEYELELKYIHLKRLLGADVVTNQIPRA